MGKRVCSESHAVPTTKTRPNPPKKPRASAVYVDQIDASGKILPKLKLTWTAPILNGSPIDRYHVQLLEVNENTQYFFFLFQRQK